MSLLIELGDGIVTDFARGVKEAIKAKDSARTAIPRTLAPTIVDRLRPCSSPWKHSLAVI